MGTKPLSSIERRTVAITGASSGIGEAFARRLAPGHDLILIARREDRLRALADELGAEYIVADLTNSADVDRVAERLRLLSDLALLINNAGFGAGGYFWQTDLQTQVAMHELHILAPLKLTHAVLPGMVERDLGAIINVASVAAFVRRPKSASYGATKTWMTTFTEAIHAELRQVRSQVLVQALCPGFTYSEFHDRAGIDREKTAPKQWWHSADDIVDASLDGLRKRKLFVIPGWRYKLLVGVLNALPTWVRVGVESRIGIAAPVRKEISN